MEHLLLRQRVRLAQEDTRGCAQPQVSASSALCRAEPPLMVGEVALV